MKFIRKVLKNIEMLLSDISDMDQIPRLFYTIMLTLVVSISTYRIILYPNLLYIFLSLILAVALRLYVYNFSVSKLLGNSFKTSIFDILSPIPIVLFLSSTLFNANFVFIHYSSFVLLIFWTVNHNSNFRSETTNPFKLVYLSLCKMITSIVLITISIFLIYLMKKPYFTTNILLSNVYAKQIYVVIYTFLKYFLKTNFMLIAINFIPMFPFELGILLENIGSYSVRNFFYSTRPFSNLIIVVLYYFGILPLIIYKIQTYALSILYTWSL